ncbi:hypothetical protein ACFC08_28470 [Streptomyces sp. NPDC056112]|uniref:hypothetical protein n=1 Tax=Streptomyces sp. NPDC056112 TaxID=3345715 RepID=UPI0035D6EF13
MSSPAEQQPAAPAVDPTLHRPLDACEYCDDATFTADPSTCPGWMRHRTKQVYRVEGWESFGAWTMVAGAKDTVAEAERRMQQLKARFPEMPMRVVAETTSYHVVTTAPGQTPPTEGDPMT